MHIERAKCQLASPYSLYTRLTNSYFCHQIVVRNDEPSSIL